MSQEAIQEFERRHGRADSFGRGVYFAKHVFAIHRMCSSPPRGAPIRVLDYGSGNGEFLAVCDAFGFEAHGVDRSAARRDISSHDRVYGTLEEAATHGPYDVISLFEVLEHVDEPRQLLDSLRRMMSDGAVLIVETPDCTGITSMEKEPHYRALIPLEHINIFEPATLRMMVEGAGFRSVKRPFVYATPDVKRVLKDLVRMLLQKKEGAGTQLYFRKEE
jgi:2-polyprenyl-3-methyl-5-hydroxy-6-metoxy-1,4-benzoquinol methylase